MSTSQIQQPNIIDIDCMIRLRKPIEEEYILALPWYQNPEVLYYSEGQNVKPYDMETIRRMYKYLRNIGELYFIEAFEDYKWVAIGDVTLSEENMPIVLGNEKFWGKGIGKKVIGRLIDRAKRIKLDRIYIPTIYKYNARSSNLFKSFGFIKVFENDEKESYELKF